VRLGHDTGTLAEFGLDKNNMGTVTQPLEKAVVHPLTEPDPFKIIIDPDDRDHGCINPKMFK
jgi:hypothetical protein